MPPSSGWYQVFFICVIIFSAHTSTRLPTSIGHTRQAPFRFALDQARARVCHTWWVDARGSFQNARREGARPAGAANFWACCAKHTSRPPSDEPRIGHTRQAPFRFPLDQARARVCRTWLVDARSTFQNARREGARPAGAAPFGPAVSNTPHDPHQTNHASDTHARHLFVSLLTSRVRGYAIPGGLTLVALFKSREARAGSQPARRLSGLLFQTHLTTPIRRTTHRTRTPGTFSFPS